MQCRLMAFSPNERYLVTHSLVEPETPQDKATMVLNLFDVRLGRCLRNFSGPADEFAVGAAAGAWPIFKWAGHPEDKCAPDMLERRMIPHKATGKNRLRHFYLLAQDSLVCAL